jgi:anion-transporting  ArsA/GET3 family ATPase
MASERITNGVKLSLAALEKGESVRDACAAGKISVTSLYQNATKKELTAAQKKGAEARLNKKEEPTPTTETAPTTQPEPAKVVPHVVDELTPRRKKNDISYLKDRVAKLERKLIDKLLEE